MRSVQRSVKVSPARASDVLGVVANEDPCMLDTYELLAVNRHLRQMSHKLQTSTSNAVARVSSSQGHETLINNERPALIQHVNLMKSKFIFPTPAHAQTESSSRLCYHS
jgi:hypothetical protein